MTRARWTFAALGLALHGCCCGEATSEGAPGATGSPEAAEHRELWRGAVDGAEVVIAAELRAWHVEGHMGPELRWVEARDFVALYESVAITRAGRDVPRFDAAEIPVELPPAPVDLAAGRASLAALPVLTCPVEHGLAYRLGERWAVLWVLGDRVLRAAPPIDARSCEGLSLPARDEWLAAHPFGATTCLALDDAGSRGAAIACMAQGVDGDLLPAEPLPPSGPLELRARAVPHVDRDLMRGRIDGDDAARESYVTHLLALVEPTDPTRAAARIATLSPPHRTELVSRIASRCEDPAAACTAAMLQLADYASRSVGALGEAGCASLDRLAAVVRARHEPEPLRRVLPLVRGSFRCDGPALRALALEGLGTATSEDVHLSSPDARHYDTVDPDCRPYLADGAREVGATCESYPRWAGSWLAARCGEDAVARARELAASRPRAPFDPREDQVLDGALRVLGACDAAAFEEAIAHVPETTLAMADVRSREHLRAVFRAGRTP
jgi:hypothetical protein